MKIPPRTVNFLAAAVLCAAGLYAAAGRAHTLNDISISSSAMVNADNIKERLKDYLGRPIDHQLLQQLLNEISGYYQHHGYPMAKAYLPEQNLSAGKVAVIVSAPVLNDVRIENKARLRQSAQERLFAGVRLEQGHPLNEEKLNAKLLKLTDLGVFDLKGDYQALSFDKFDLNLTALARKPLNFTVFADNHGTKAAGRYRFGGTVTLPNASGNADTASIFYARTDEGQNNFALTYALPVNSHPSVVELSLCLNDYELGHEYEELGAKGKSLSFEALWKEPVYRSQYTKLSAFAGGRYRKLNDEFTVFDVEFKKHSLAAFAGIEGLWQQDQWRHQLKASALYGKLTIDDEYQLAEDNHYAIFNLTAGTAYQFNPYLNVSLDAELQLASRALDSSEQFLAGGALANAAYQSSDAAGDSGALAKLALNLTPMPDFNLTFSPHLTASTVKSRNFERESLYGAGIDAFFSHQGFFIKAQADAVIGPKLRPDCDDGQFYLQLGYLFS